MSTETWKRQKTLQRDMILTYGARDRCTSKAQDPCVVSSGLAHRSPPLGRTRAFKRWEAEPDEDLRDLRTAGGPLAARVLSLEMHSTIFVSVYDPLRGELTVLRSPAPHRSSSSHVSPSVLLPARVRGATAYFAWYFAWSLLPTFVAQ
ncbi:hypothetical protein AXG93_1024s1170 [Marchantia polymorpha subsp. ruderalis]|uniref:Uncharacterized protein n=1 Tax=Marchantia polymorpha subsp. ruderalis TaxID=1480154 RepID=A0A176VN27_MARPO|nr:hypothetical protein AXG93_1024s1170 [Marchantia polymorpha subsp. ruderalis]